MISKLRSLLTRKDKKFLLALLILSILLSMIETIGISAIMPFISIASNPTLIDSGYYREIYDFFEFKEKNGFVIAFGFLLIGFYFFRAAFSIYYFYLLNRFSFSRYHQFAFKLFQSYLGLPYKEFIKRNTGTLTTTIVHEASNLTTLVQSTLLLFSEFFTILFLYIILLLINWKITLVLSFVLLVKVLLLTKTLSKIIKLQGEKRAIVQEKFYRILGETFGNFKMVKLIGNEKNILDSFSQASNGFSRANIINATINTIPKNVLETIGFSALIAVIIYILYIYKDASFVIPVISMYALAMYRMLPAINRIINNYNVILFARKSLDLVHTDLMYDIENEGSEKISFNESIELSGINFSYDGKNDVVKNITLTIRKGGKIAFIGESGSGKSTLVDIITGIYKPCKGKILIDSKELTVENIRSWRAKVGYIPQSIYLFDATVAENVSFGNTIDESKIIDVLKKANVWDFLASKNGIHTRVGEGGIQLSGGQKQRIGIARALYGDPEILVLDEATSALDTETESKIMDEIYDISNDKTLIVIAHRLSTIERCEKKFKLKNGVLD